MAGVLALSALGLGLGSYTLLGARQLERKTLAAISRGDLVLPARVSAFDYYQRITDEYPRSASAARVREAATPAVVEAMDRFYDDWYATSEAEASEWTRMERLGSWAALLLPDDPRVHARWAYAQARVAVDGDDPDAARASYQRAVELWPEWALPHNSLGVLEVQAKNYDQAETHYRAASEKDPEWAFPMSNLGGLYLRLRRYGAARTVLARAVVAAPERPMSHLLLARALAGTGDYDAAVQEAEAVLRLDPAGTSGFDPGRLRREAEEWQVHGWYDGIDEEGYDGVDYGYE